MTTKAGTYYAPMPVDFMILGLLPEIGTIGGVHWKGRRVKDLVDQIGIPEVDSSLMQSRLRSMRVAIPPLVKKFPAGQATVWARTQEGAEMASQAGEILGETEEEQHES